MSYNQDNHNKSDKQTYSSRDYDENENNSARPFHQSRNQFTDDASLSENDNRRSRRQYRSDNDYYDGNERTHRSRHNNRTEKRSQRSRNDFQQYNENIGYDEYNQMRTGEKNDLYDPASNDFGRENNELEYRSTKDSQSYNSTVNDSEKPKNNLYFGLYFFFVILLFYSIHDLYANEIIGGETGVNRIWVYISLFACIVYTFCYSLYYHIAYQHLFPTGIMCLVFILCWEIILYFGAYEDVMSMQRTITRWNKLVIIAFSVLWVLLYNFFFYYHLQYKAVWKQTLIFVCVFFGFYLMYAYFAMTFSQERLNRMTVIGSYYILVFVPWLYFVPKLYRRIGLILILIVAVFSAKRGVIIALPLMLLNGYLVYFLNRKASVKTIIFSIITLLFFGITLAVANEYYEGRLLERFSEEEISSGSGRRKMWTTLTTSFFTDTSLPVQITGHGIAATIGGLRTSSHNDWIGFLWDYGYVGFLFLLTFFLLLFRRLIWLIRKKSIYAPPYASMLTLMFMMTLYSVFYASHNSIFIFLFLGFVEARLYFEEEEKQNRTIVQPVSNEYRQRIHRRRHRSSSNEHRSHKSSNQDGQSNRRPE